MIKLDFARRYRRVLVLLLLLAVINLVYVTTNSFELNRSSLDLVKAATGQFKSNRIYHIDELSKLAIIQESTLVNPQKSDLRSFQLNTPRPITNPNDLQSQGFNVISIKEYDYANATDTLAKGIIEMAKDGSLIKLEYDDEFKSAFQRFFEDLFEMLDQCKPGIPSINNDDHYRIARDTDKYPNRDGRIPLYGGHLRENYLEEVVRTEQVLANYLRLDDNEINGLKGSHASFMKKMVKEFPPDLFKFGKYNEFMKGDGIVYLGGDDYNQLALLSIKMLRSTGSQLPVELIVPHESDYDVDLCNNILPALNGKCKVMSHYLPKELISNIQGYQYKNVALLISSFENVLYLDADNLPIQNPDSLFANEPFTNHHLVIWPDLWRRSTSPSFYTIADIQVNPKIRERSSYFNGDKRGENDPISFHDAMGAIPEASSETGQLLINKRVHFSTLVLSMYYNYYGPDYFYPLLSQGAAGEGDKETFIAAAHKLDLPYYQVKEFNREFGPLKNGKHEFFGMGQYDPLVDYIQDTNKDIALTTEFVPDYALNSDDKEHSNYDYHYFKSSSLMFLHANWPKYKLHEMFNHNSYGRGPTFDGKRRRLYEWNIIDETYGFDVELSIMSSLQWLYCEMNINLKKVPEVGSEDRTKICLEINSHISFMISVQ